MMPHYAEFGRQLMCPAPFTPPEVRTTSLIICGDTNATALIGLDDGDHFECGMGTWHGINRHGAPLVVGMPSREAVARLLLRQQAVGGGPMMPAYTRDHLDPAVVVVFQRQDGTVDRHVVVRGNGWKTLTAAVNTLLAAKDSLVAGDVLRIEAYEAACPPRVSSGLSTHPNIRGEGDPPNHRARGHSQRPTGR